MITVSHLLFVNIKFRPDRPPVQFLYVDILDTTGTLYSMAKFAGLRDPVTMDFENSTVAYCVDAISISLGALMGTSPVTAFIESATGISEGGKTGLTAVTTGLMFFVCVSSRLFLRAYRVGRLRCIGYRWQPDDSKVSRLKLGGLLMLILFLSVREINWDYVGDLRSCISDAGDDSANI